MRERVRSMRKRLVSMLSQALLYLRLLGKWMVLAVICGAACGLTGSLFHHSVHTAGIWFAKFPGLLWGLPVAGLAIVWIYRVTHTDGQGTNDILDHIHLGRGISPQLLPAIFVCTFLTHLCGGSAGREGAALQMGGVIGYHTGMVLHLDDTDRRTTTTAGMAAFFTALFGTPIAATVFALTVVNVGRFYPADLLPALTASLTAFGISVLLGVEPTHFSVTMPATEPVMMIRITLFAAACALLSVLFCEMIHAAERGMKKYLPNPWKRAAAGGILLIILTLLCRTRAYNGAGMESITAAVESGIARPEAFFMKLLFTAITLGSGFKGGEVVPSFFVGATFGAAWGTFFGIPAEAAAAVGLICVFCGATNCPLASIFLAVELFGNGGLMYFAAACVISYVLSGYSGLYSSQVIVYSKFRARYINAGTNAHRLGDGGELH